MEAVTEALEEVEKEPTITDQPEPVINPPFVETEEMPQINIDPISSKMDTSVPEETYPHEIRILMLNCFAGAIIGKGGERIKAFHEKYNVHVSIPVTHTTLRTVVITGKRTPILKSLVDILPFMKKPPIETFEGREHQINLIVPDGYAPIIIGTKGAKIMSLRKEANCFIKVFDHNLPNCDERLLVISGDLHNVITIIGAIMSIIETHKLRKSVVRFDTRRISHDDLLHALRIDSAPYSSRPYRERSPRGRDPYYQPSFAPPYSNHPNHNSPIHSTQVSVPVKHVHTIMGKQGYRLRKIEGSSGCRISLGEAQPNCSLRIITLTGTEKQINDAEYYLQETIREFERTRR